MVVLFFLNKFYIRLETIDGYAKNGKNNKHNGKRKSDKKSSDSNAQSNS